MSHPVRDLLAPCALILCVTAASARAQDSVVPSHPLDEAANAHATVRGVQPWITAVAEEAYASSPTFAGLADLLAAHRVIVHVDELADDTAAWDGRIQFAGLAGGYTYLRVQLRRLGPRVAASVLAHELRHAVEVIDAGVTTRAGFTALFQRIGVEREGHRGQVDTAAAVSSGVATFAELQGVSGGRLFSSRRAHVRLSSK